MHRPTFFLICGCLLEVGPATSGLSLGTSNREMEKAVFMIYKIDFTGDADTLNVIKVEVTSHLSSDVSSAVTASAKADADTAGK